MSNDPFHIISRMDSQALLHLMAALPDPVAARLINIAPSHLRGRIIGGVEKPRMDASVHALMRREEGADAEKDQIVRAALSKFIQDLLKAGRIKRDGEFYLGA